MASTSYEQVLSEAEPLSRDEQLRLIRELADHAAGAASTTSVMDLCGLGHEISGNRERCSRVRRRRAGLVEWVKPLLGHSIGLDTVPLSYFIQSILYTCLIVFLLFEAVERGNIGVVTSTLRWLKF